MTYQALIQRLGKSTCDFTYYLSHDEYQYFIWMEKVRHAIKEKQWDELEKLLAMVYKPVSLCNEKLRTQYYMYLQAILMIERNQDYEEASKLVKQAISVTKPNRRFTEMEINLFLLESVLAKKIGNTDEEEQVCRLEELVSYVKSNVTDEKEQIKLIVKLIYISVREYANWIKKEERIHVLEEVLQKLRKRGILYYLPQIMEFYLDELEDETEEVTQLKKQKMAIEELLKQFGDLGEFSIYELQMTHEFEVLIGEYLFFHRAEQELTQEEMAEGICEPESYSRIETGKRKPKKKSYEAFADKLGIPCHYYDVELDTDDYYLLELKQKISHSSTRGKLKDEQGFIVELEQKIDLDSVRNRQYCEMVKNANAFRQGNISAEELIARDLKALAYTIQEEKVGKKSHIYSQVEIILINHIANGYRANNQQENAAKLLQKLVDDMQVEKFRNRYERMPIYIMSCQNLGQYYSDMEKYERAIPLFQRNVQLLVQNRDGGGIAKNLAEIALAYENIKGTSDIEVEQLFRQTFYISELFHNEKIHEVILEHCNNL